MNARNPYLFSMLGHALVLSLVLSMVTLRHGPVTVPGVHIISLPGGGARGGRGGARQIERREPLPKPAPAAQATPPPKPKPVEPDKAKKPPKPAEKVPPPRHAKPAESHGALPPPDTGPVSKTRSSEATAPPTAVVPALAAGTGRGSDEGAGHGSGRGIGVEAEGEGGDAPWYWTQLRDKIADAWRPPPIPGRSGEARVKVHFVLSPDGVAQATEVRESSRVSAFDLAAMRAIFDARPLPPFPPELGTEAFGITLTFHQQY